MRLDTLYRDIGRNIQERRVDRGWIQEDLADKAGLGRTSIANIETGRQQAPLHKLILIARALKINYKKLLP